MAGLKAIVDALEGEGGVEEALRPLYVPGEGALEGKFVLNVEPVGTFKLEDVGGLKSALAKERQSLANAQKTLKPYEGLDPAAARAALEKMKEMDDWDPDKKLEEYKKQLAKQAEGEKNQLIEKHTGEVGTLNGRMSVLTKQLEDALITSSAVKALDAQDAFVDLVLPHVKAMTRIRQNEDGSFAVEVLDAEGTPRLSPKTGSQSPMSIEELVVEMSTNPKYAPGFGASKAKGSGASRGAAGTAGSVIVLTAAESKDPGKYRAAKERATKEGKELQILPA